MLISVDELLVAQDIHGVGEALRPAGDMRDIGAALDHRALNVLTDNQSISSFLLLHLSSLIARFLVAHNRSWQNGGEQIRSL